MSGILLRKVLMVLEETQTPISSRGIAQQLDIPTERAESMLEFWLRKGRIRLSEDAQDCGMCGINDSCPFVVDLPRSYELVQSRKS